MVNFLEKLKRFFWLVSGSEISILEKCPTDHNRHMNIGLAIFTTTLVAFFAGCLAGFRLGNQTIFSAVLFGILWSTVVFTIDRNMVGTLQKTPENQNKKLKLALYYRVFLSLLLSFFIAIPLELWIFQEEIAKQMKEDNAMAIVDKREVEKSKNNVSGLQQQLDDYSKEQAKLNVLINKKDPPPGYKNFASVQSSMKETKDLYHSKLQEYRNKVRLRKKYYKRAPEYYDSTRNEMVKVKDSEYYKKWSALWNLTNSSGSMTKSLNRTKEKYQSLASRVSSIKEEYFSNLSQRKQEIENKLANKQDALESNLQEVEESAEEHEGFVSSQDGFIKQLTALHHIKEFWVIFFIWFIRLVFFIIEMLPTLSKYITPMGAYDLKYYYRTKEVESREAYQKKRLEKVQKKKMELEAEHMEKLEKQKLDHELKMKENLLKKLSERQNRLTEEILNEWERQQKNKAEEDISRFIEDSKNGMGIA